MKIPKILKKRVNLLTYEIQIKRKIGRGCNGLWCVCILDPPWQEARGISHIGVCVCVCVCVSLCISDEDEGGVPVGGGLGLVGLW